MSGGEIKKRYLNNSSFDLRRFISGSEKFLHSICDSIERWKPSMKLFRQGFIFSDPAFFLQGLNLVPFASSKRDQIGSILASCRDCPDKGQEPALVYSMLCYDGKVLAMCQVRYLNNSQRFTVLGQIYSKLWPNRRVTAPQPDKKSTKSQGFRSLASCLLTKTRRRPLTPGSYFLYRSVSFKFVPIWLSVHSNFKLTNVLGTAECVW